eukprot:3804515-Rhodomonas_salina.2
MFDLIRSHSLINAITDQRSHKSYREGANFALNTNKRDATAQKRAGHSTFRGLAEPLAFPRSEICCKDRNNEEKREVLNWIRDKDEKDSRESGRDGLEGLGINVA